MVLPMRQNRRCSDAVIFFEPSVTAVAVVMTIGILIIEDEEIMIDTMGEVSIASDRMQDQVVIIITRGQLIDSAITVRIIV